MLFVCVCAKNSTSVKWLLFVVVVCVVVVCVAVVVCVVVVVAVVYGGGGGCGYDCGQLISTTAAATT